MIQKYALSQFKNLQTPFYYYDLSILEDTLKEVKKYGMSRGYHVHYALKANTNDTILRTICEAGLGADCVSGNEVKKALEVGFAPDHIAFAGVGKTDDEIIYALQQDIFSLNCESIHEIEVINTLAEAHDLEANVAIRINPNINANTHHYITTGLEENKFGISVAHLDSFIEKVLAMPRIKWRGLHFHLGSQICDMTIFSQLCNKINALQKYLGTKNIILDHINVGGGLGVNYIEPDTHLVPDMKSYFDVFADHIQLQSNQTLHFELGRAIVAQCGSLITKVLYIKEGINKNFAIVDAGMTELMRPALYQAYHKIENLSSTASTEKLYDVVGPICESTDYFGKNVLLPIISRGDIIAVRTAGAYGEAMASSYNLRNKAKAYCSNEL